MPRDVNEEPRSAVHVVITGGVNTGKTRLALAIAGFDKHLMSQPHFRTMPSSMVSGPYVASIRNQRDSNGLDWSITD